MSKPEKWRVDAGVLSVIWNTWMCIEYIVSELNYSPSVVKSSLNRLMKVGKVSRQWQEFSSDTTGTWHHNNQPLPHWRHIYKAVR